MTRRFQLISDRPVVLLHALAPSSCYVQAVGAPFLSPSPHFPVMRACCSSFKADQINMYAIPIRPPVNHALEVREVMSCARAAATELLCALGFQATNRLPSQCSLMF